MAQRMDDFFEKDQDEFPFGNRVYVDFFNLYPALSLAPTIEHLSSLHAVTVVDYAETSEGWQIEARFCGMLFLLDTHYHGGATQFCVEKWKADHLTMLAFLGCFLPLLRDHWQPPTTRGVTKRSWMQFWSFQR